MPPDFGRHAICYLHCLQRLIRHPVGQVNQNGIFLRIGIRYFRRAEEACFRQHRTEYDVERGPAPFIAFQKNGAVVLFRNAERDRQAKVVAAQVGKVHAGHAQRDEDRPELCRRDAHTVIADGDVGVVAILRDRKADAITVFAALRAVGNDVEQHPLNERRVERAVDRFVRDDDLEHDTVGIRDRLDVIKQCPAFFAQIAQLRHEREGAVVQAGGRGGIEREAQQPVVKLRQLGGIAPEAYVTELHGVVREIRRERAKSVERRQKRRKLRAGTQGVFILRHEREQPKRTKRRYGDDDVAFFDCCGRDEFRGRGFRDVRRQQLGELVIRTVAAKKFLCRRVHKGYSKFFRVFTF